MSRPLLLLLLLLLLPAAHIHCIDVAAGFFYSRKKISKQYYLHKKFCEITTLLLCSDIDATIALLGVANRVTTPIRQVAAPRPPAGLTSPWGGRRRQPIDRRTSLPRDNLSEEENNRGRHVTVSR